MTKGGGNTTTTTPKIFFLFSRFFVVDQLKPSLIKSGVADTRVGTHGLSLLSRLGDMSATGALCALLWWHLTAFLCLITNTETNQRRTAREVHSLNRTRLLPNIHLSILYKTIPYQKVGAQRFNYNFRCKVLGEVKESQYLVVALRSAHDSVQLAS